MLTWTSRSSAHGTPQPNASRHQGATRHFSIRHALSALLLAVNLQCVVHFVVTELGHMIICQLLLHRCKGIATGWPRMVCRRRSIAEESRAPSLQVTPAASPVRSTRGIAGLWGFTTPKKRR